MGVIDRLLIDTENYINRHIRGFIFCVVLGVLFGFYAITIGLPPLQEQLQEWGKQPYEWTKIDHAILMVLVYIGLWRN